MIPKQHSEVARCIGWLAGMKGKFFVPSRIVYEAKAEITAETLARKLRDYSKEKNPVIKKHYYTINGGTRVAIYGANEQYKEKK